MTRKICGRDPQNPRRFLQHADCEIARVTQDASNRPGPMVMVELWTLGRPSTNGADATLRGQEGVVFSRSDSVGGLSPVGGPTFAERRSPFEISCACTALTTRIAPVHSHRRPVGVPTRAGLAERLLLAYQQRVTVSLPAVVMHSAPTSRRALPVAAVDRAGRILSNPSGIAPGCVDDKWVTVCPPTHVVRLAPAARSGCTRAVLNGAERRIELHQGAVFSLVWPTVVCSNRRLYCAERTLRCR
jgi:hypothetical protein